MKQVKAIPPMEYMALRDPWLDDLLDGKLREIFPHGDRVARTLLGRDLPA